MNQRREIGSKRDMKDPHRGLSRRRLLAVLALALPASWLGGCRSEPAGAQGHRPFASLDLSEQQWRHILTPEQYRVLRRDGTEQAFSSPLDKEWSDGTYVCAGCNLPLFASAHKYDSGTGWPSFWRPINDEHVGTRRDFKLVIPRTEYHCARCGGHQGHVFNDGPQPTGQRWCNNGVALNFVPDSEPLPELREA
jgi:peptide-methionine (R)-S-oxide reductase